MGFSLVEVLVVTVIISILAAIGIPAFITQRERGWEAQTVSALKNAATTMESAATRRGGSYEGITTAELREEEGLRYARSIVILAIVGANDEGFCLSALHDDSGLIRYWDSADGVPSSSDCSGTY